jgi:NAD(P)H-dependent flavin oxidoreductase YrpB (nitropropane dioxygenase family)
MGGVGTPELAGAVAASGGLGMLPAVADGPLTLRLKRSLDLAGDGPVGVNFLLPFLTPEGHDDVEHAASQARVVEFFWGEPDPRLAGLVRTANPAALLCWQVGSAREARAAVDAGCDLIVAQGVEAGGHVRGTIGLLPLLAEVLAEVGDEVLVIAAGGIATATGVAAVLAAGAAAVRVGTRFVATPESAAHPDYVDALISASGADTVLTTAFGVGWPDAPHRVLERAVHAAERHTRADDDAGRGAAVASFVGGDGSRFPLPYWSSMPPTVEVDGDVGAMALYAGEGVGAVRARRPAAEVLEELVAALPGGQGSPGTSGG